MHTDGINYYVNLCGYHNENLSHNLLLYHINFAISCNNYPGMYMNLPSGRKGGKINPRSSNCCF